MKNKALEGKRILWLDVGRLIAIVSITFNHAVNRAYLEPYNGLKEEYLNSSLSSDLIKSSVLVFSKLGVPLFLMITGALLLKKRIVCEEDFKRFYRHNLLSLFITSEIWYVIMYWFIAFCSPGHEMLKTQSFGDLVLGMIKTMFFLDQVTMRSMWYIPMILCLYLIIPFFSMALNKISLRFIIIPCGIVLLCSSIIPDFNLLMRLLGSEIRIETILRSNNVFSFYFLFVFLGYWISCEGLKKIKTVWIAFAAILSFIAVCLFQMIIFQKSIEYTMDYNFSGILIIAPLMFEWIRRGADRLKKAAQAISYLSRISFGIYFIHILIMNLLYWYIPAFESRSLYMLFLEIMSFGLSVGFIATLSQSPVLRKYLFMIK